MINLDTHIFVDAIRDELSSTEMSVLKRGKRWGISSIVLWEIEKLAANGLITLTLDNPNLVELLEEIQVWEINRNVCVALRRLDFKSDPADELIAATSLAYRVPLLTRDKTILTSKVVPLA